MNNQELARNHPWRKARVFRIHVLRERLRLAAVDRCSAMSRSVARLASADALPCLEYGDEVARESALACEAMYLQYCRSALERCIASGSAGFRFRWPDGFSTATRFVRGDGGTVKAVNLQADLDRPAA